MISPKDKAEGIDEVKAWKRQLLKDSAEAVCLLDYKAKIKVMKILRPLSPAELARAEDRLLHPAPGSRIEAAQKYGIDLTLLIEQLRLTPAERVKKLELATIALEKVRGLARKRS